MLNLNNKTNDDINFHKKNTKEKEICLEMKNNLITCRWNCVRLIAGNAFCQRVCDNLICSRFCQNFFYYRTCRF